jgi:ribosome-binding protein aMBF1 (putative translation factor)
MAVCKSCGEEADELIAVRVAGKTKKVCEDCADKVREEQDIAAEGEATIQKMMEYKGRR